MGLTEDQEKLRLLADWFDRRDERRFLIDETSHEVQRDLRRIADLIEALMIEHTNIVNAIRDSWIDCPICCCSRGHETDCPVARVEQLTSEQIDDLPIG